MPFANFWLVRREGNELGRADTQAHLLEHLQGRDIFPPKALWVTHLVAKLVGLGDDLGDSRAASDRAKDLHFPLTRPEMIKPGIGYGLRDWRCAVRCGAMRWPKYLRVASQISSVQCKSTTVFWSPALITPY